MNHENIIIMKNKQKEISRLNALLSYNIIDTLKEKEFDKLAQLASIICETPIALISLIDNQRQWYKAKVGIDTDEIPLELTFCQYTIEKDDLWEVEDASKHELLKDNPNVNAENGIRYYAGIPLQSDTGYNIGTLCVADTKPKRISEKEKIALKIISEQIMILLEAKKNNESLIAELRNLLKEKELESKKILEKNTLEIKMFYDSISNTNGIIEIDINGKIINTNPLMKAILEIDDTLLIGNNIATFLDFEISNENIPYYLDHKNHTLEYKKDEELSKWLQINFIKIEGIDGTIEKLILICQDVTSRVLGQLELQNAKDVSDYLNQQKDQFIATVSHEIRTPINAILGFTDVLIEIEEDYKKMDFLTSIKTAGLGLLHIVNDILDISKIEAGMIQIDDTPFQLDEIISNVYSTLKLKASEKNLKFLYAIDSDVEYQLIGDKNRLNQILINIVGNAIKFTEKGKIELRVSVEKTGIDECHLKFCIEDTGIGINEAKLKSIFDRFSQAEVSTTRKFGGTGLGLSISKELIELQLGNIDVKSKENEGTIFSFVIPYKINHNNILSFNKNNRAELLETPSKNILLCEDNELNQKLIKTIFEKTKHKIQTANNGIEALELLRNNTFDLILMDLQMPKMDGYETTTLIREDLQLNIPIIALTANSLIYEKERCMGIGMNDYLSKPFSKNDLFDMLNRFFYDPTERNYHPTTTSLSIDNLKDFFGHNHKQIRNIIQLFEEQLKTLFELLNAFPQNNAFDDIRNNAHKMKSSFGMFSIDATQLDIVEYASNKELLYNNQKILLPLKSQLANILQELKTITNEIGTH